MLPRISLCGHRAQSAPLPFPTAPPCPLAATHQHLLQLLHRLVDHADAVDLPDLVSDVQRSWNGQRTAGFPPSLHGNEKCYIVPNIVRKCLPCLWIIPPCIILATMQWLESFIFSVMPCRHTQRISQRWGVRVRSAGQEAHGYHGLVRVFLKLDQSDPGDVVQVHVPVGALGRVSVQVRRGGRRRHPQRLVAVDLVGDHVVGLQQGLPAERG